MVGATHFKLHDPLKDLKNWFQILQKDAQNSADAVTAGYNLDKDPLQQKLKLFKEKPPTHATLLETFDLLFRFTRIVLALGIALLP